jgi:hypothetical protein
MPWDFLSLLTEMSTKLKFYWREECGKCVRLTSSPSWGNVESSISRNSESLHSLLQLYFSFKLCSTSQETRPWASTACYGNSFTLLYIDDFVLHGKQIRASTSCYGDSVSFLCVDIRTSQETHIRASTAHFGDRHFSYLYNALSCQHCGSQRRFLWEIFQETAA